MITTLEEEAAAILAARITLELARGAWNPARSREFTSAMDALSDALEMYDSLLAGTLHWEAFEAELDEQLAWERLGMEYCGQLRYYYDPHVKALQLAAGIAVARSAAVECLPESARPAGVLRRIARRLTAGRAA